MRIVISAAMIAVIVLAVLLAFDMNDLARWAAEQQRGFQNRMASAVRALRAGDLAALASLLAAAGAYGFVHALGPGHGKFLIGGVGLGSSVSPARLSSIALASSLAQALWAIALVYGGFFLLEASARRMTALADDYLAPLSYAAIALIGAALVWRGARAIARDASSKGRCGCSGHGPRPDEVAKLRSARDVAALIASIAVRPCTGAIFLLVIAWQMDIRAAGAAAVIVMGLGTALFTSLVALSSVAARGAVFASAGVIALPSVAPALQIAAGLLVLWFSLLLFGLGG